MKLKEKLKYAKYSLISGGVSFVKMEELQPSQLLYGKNVLIFSSNKTPFEVYLKQRTSELGANVVVDRYNTDTFVNIISVDTDIKNLKGADEQINKRLFFILQEEKTLLISKIKSTSIINIIELKSKVVDGIMDTIISGIENLTRSIAIATANGQVVVNTIICENLLNSQKGVSDLTVFMASNCSNDILGQVIGVGED